MNGVEIAERLAGLEARVAHLESELAAEQRVISRITQNVTELGNRLARALEVNELWDGS